MEKVIYSNLGIKYYIRSHPVAGIQCIPFSRQAVMSPKVQNPLPRHSQGDHVSSSLIVGKNGIRLKAKH